MTIAAEKTMVTGKGEGTALWVMNWLFETKIPSDATGGAFTMVEMLIPPGPQSATPPHRHDGTETVYVVDGSVTFHIGDSVFELEQGDTVFIPKSTLEWFEATGDRPARLLSTFVPGGIDKFFEEVGREAEERNLPSISEVQPDFEKLAAAGRKYGLEILAPVRR